MRIELDAESAKGFAFTLSSSDSVFLDLAAASRITRGQAVEAAGADHPHLPAAIEDFVRAHEAAFEAFATAFAGLSGDVRTVLATHAQLEASIKASMSTNHFVGPTSAGADHR